jgi:hypothetical protein
MFFAVPIVGKILAGFAASEASAGAPTTQKIDQLKVQSRGSVPVDPADFSQTLDSLDHAASAKAHSLFDSAKL